MNLGADEGFYFSHRASAINVLQTNIMLDAAGVSIMLHAPDEIPNAINKYKTIPFGDFAKVFIKPQVTKTSTALQEMRLEMFV